MVGIAEISALMTSLKGAKDIAEAMVGLRDAAARQSKVIEFQNVIMDAQQSVFAIQQERAALVEKVSELEEQVARLEKWNSEKERYELSELGNGTVAYRIKDAVRGTEPPHWICANCYDDGKKSHLQPEVRFPGSTKVYVCHACGSELTTEGGREASHGRPLPTHAVTKRPRNR